MQCIATATLAAYVNFATLGLLIREGLANHSSGHVQVFAGGLLVVALALAAEISWPPVILFALPTNAVLQEFAKSSENGTDPRTSSSALVKRFPFTTTCAGH